MISLKNAIVTAIVVAIVRVYMHHGDKGSYEHFVKTFKESCITEGKKEITDSRIVGAIEPMCECMTNNNDMQDALKEAYNKEDLEKAKQSVKAIAKRIAPACAKEYFGIPDNWRR